MTSFSALMAFTLIPIAAMIAGGAFALLRTPGPRMRSGIMHLAGGVVFAVVALELLPSVVHSAAIVSVTVGFAAGTALMLGLRHYLGGHAEEEEPETSSPEAPKSAIGMLAGIGVDLFVDGLMLGIGFAAGERAGALLTVALTLEAVSLGLATAASLAQRGMARRRVLARIVGLALLLAVGAAVGGLGVSYAPAALTPGLLAFGCAALLFLVTEELLDEAHTVKETPLLTLMFFVGFLALMVLEMFGAAH